MTREKAVQLGFGQDDLAGTSCGPSSTADDGVDLLLTPNAVFGCPGGYWDFRLLEHSRTNPERSSGQPAHHGGGRNEHRAPYPHRPTLSSSAMGPLCYGASFRIGRHSADRSVE